jgi:hypothetical protein
MRSVWLLAVLMTCALVFAPLALAQEDGDSSDSSSATTSIDPCQLVTADEASALAGTTYTTGLEQTSSAGSRLCVYGYQTQNVFMVVVAQATDASTAQAAFDDEQARVQDLMQKNLPAGVSVAFGANDDPNLTDYDRAALGQGSATILGRTINGSAVYLLKGATFVSFSDLVLNNAAPTSDVLESQAVTVFGRLP